MYDCIISAAAVAMQSIEKRKKRCMLCQVTDSIVETTHTIHNDDDNKVEYELLLHVLDMLLCL